MKKTLFLSAILGAALCGTTLAETQTVTIDGQTYDVAVVNGAQTDIPDADAHAFLFNYSFSGNDATYHSNGTKNPWIGNLTNEDTLIFTATDDEAFTAHKAFFDTGDNSLTINAKILTGGAGNTDLRFWTKNANVKAILNGDVTVAADKTNIWMQNGRVDINGKLIAAAGRVFCINNAESPNSGTVMINGSLADFNGTMQVKAASLQLESLASGLQLGAGSTVNFSSGKIQSANGFVINNSTIGNIDILADGGQRIAATKAVQSLTLTAGSEKTLASITTTDNNAGWLLVEGVGNTETGLYTDVILNSTHTGESGLIIKTANTTAHIGSLAGTSTTATVRGDWGKGANRNLVLHQNSDTSFAGTFVKCTNDSGVRDIQLTKEGTGTLTLTADNKSSRDLIINDGGVTFSGAGAWAGNIIVNEHGTLTYAVTDAAIGNVTLNAGSTINLTFGNEYRVEIIPTVGNGFSTYAYRKEIGNVITNNGGTINLNGYTAALNDGVVTGTVDTTTYYVNEGMNITSLPGATALVVNSTSGSVNQLGLSNTTYGNLDITINGGRVITAKNGNKWGFTQGDVTVNAGGTLAIVESGQDSLGWSEGKTKSITLLGSEEAKATLELSFNSETDSTTLATALNLNGYSQVTGPRTFNTYGGVITASGKGNVISAGVALRTSASFVVNAGGELLISGNVCAGNDSDRTMTKTGDGVLTISGDITDVQLKDGATAITINGDGANTIITSASINGTTAGGVTLNNVTLDNTAMTLSGNVNMNNVGIKSSFVNNGTLTLSGTTNYTGATSTREVELTTGNGFGTVETYAQVITGTGSVAGTTTWTYNGQATTSYNNGELITGMETSTIYYVNDATAGINVVDGEKFKIKTDSDITVNSGTFDYDNISDGANNIKSVTLSGEASLKKGIFSLTGNGASITPIAGTTFDIAQTDSTVSGGTARIDNNGDWDITLYNKLSNVNLTYTGTIADKTLKLKNENTLGDVTIKNGGTLQIEGGTTAISGTAQLNNVVVDKNATLKVDGTKLTVSDGSDVTVKGDLLVTGLADKAVLELNSMTINGGTVTLGSVDNHDYTLALQNLTVNATEEAPATVNADLVLKNDANVTMNGVLTMGCALSIGSGTVLKVDAELGDVDAGPVALFDSVEGLTLGTTEITKMGWYDANGILASINGTDITADGQYVIGYWDGVVSVAEASVPEPATATLSLLALAALAARRRRH